MIASEFWEQIHSERTKLLSLLESLSDDQWRTTSLCSAWTVEDVVAHLTAAASTGRWAWISNMLRSGFNTDKHNARLLAKFKGRTPQDTLGRFRGAIANTVAPTADYAAFLGEVVVHGQDIARPLGLELVPDPAGLQEVAGFFASKDFAVNSKTLVKGLRLKASDASFEAGEGPVVRGALLDLVMAMAGRGVYCEALSGEGVPELRRRIERPA
ncbi:maleylpyruvate isomerase family mycothiol-dependent enzyme [Leucobacter viscericola]|uniref:Maleylpyruvate isomerase family mycothiol-dependent enzyme n=1 Tax=Leucobacter viscericola TaxID=2714935 RepID=A0A6G7XGZ0_9MICO|nr:maleylpyruvate isomerase family mycothiol-dependent enzyme [Leucobacter viscericola]QIK63870.1 maleylpyruvate isomerase family mycothiol-dependent enzyme [Leucobacter viscericola]